MGCVSLLVPVNLVPLGLLAFLVHLLRRRLILHSMLSHHVRLCVSIVRGVVKTWGPEKIVRSHMTAVLRHRAPNQHGGAGT